MMQFSRRGGRIQRAAPLPPKPVPIINPEYNNLFDFPTNEPPKVALERNRMININELRVIVPDEVDLEKVIVDENVVEESDDVVIEVDDVVIEVDDVVVEVDDVAKENADESFPESDNDDSNDPVQLKVADE
jgi:hypothetical protein